MIGIKTLEIQYYLGHQNVENKRALHIYDVQNTCAYLIKIISLLLNMTYRQLEFAQTR